MSKEGPFYTKLPPNIGHKRNKHIVMGFLFVCVLVSVKMEVSEKKRITWDQEHRGNQSWNMYHVNSILKEEQDLDELEGAIW